jgi:TolB protein
MYYRLLNSGFQLAATGGSDNFADVWRDPPAGTARTYAKINGSLTVDSWLEAVDDGKTFASNGPILFAKVEDQLPGSEISLSGQGADTLSVQGEVHSIVPLNQIDILLNGEVIKSIDIRETPFPVEFSAQIEVPDNGWIAVRTYGPYHRYLTDSYPFAHTTPVYVLRNEERYTSTEDAMFLHDAVEALWQSVEDRNSWNRTAEKEKYRQAVDKAKQVYHNIAKGDYNFEN